MGMLKIDPRGVWGLEVHPAALKFPLMSKEELAPIVEDMRKNGYNKGYPIAIYQGWVLDGRNRLAAAKVAGVEPNLRMLPDDADPWVEVVRANVHRRHLTIRQVADVLKSLESFRRDVVEETERAKTRDAATRAKKGVAKQRAPHGAGQASRPVKPERADAGYTRTVLAKKYGAPEKAVRLAMKEVKAETAPKVEPKPPPKKKPVKRAESKVSTTLMAILAAKNLGVPEALRALLDQTHREPLAEHLISYWSDANLEWLVERLTRSLKEG
jgi:hypothetical protein